MNPVGPAPTRLVGDLECAADTENRQPEMLQESPQRWYAPTETAGPPSRQAQLQTPTALQETTLSSHYDARIIPDLSVLKIATPMLEERCVVKMQLKNGVKVYIISDPGAEKSGASMTVRAGSWQDPDEWPGMAHFVEHMLFMGTQQFPDEAEYETYLSQFDGTYNAYTAGDHTQYMLDCNSPGFEGALERFAGFFTSPLLKPSCLQRERHAVESEFTRNKDSEPWRLALVQAELANLQHPASRFTIGNLATLQALDAETLRSWYQAHYSADLMHLVLCSPRPSAELQQLAEKYFGDIASHDAKPLAISVSPLGGKGQGALTFVESRRKNDAVLVLRWPVDESLAKDLDGQPASVVAYILGHGGDNTLQSKLTGLGWATAVHVGLEAHLSGGAALELSVKLTEDGVKEHDAVTMWCFAAIQSLRRQGVPEELFEEMRQAAMRNYRFQSREQPFSAVSQHGKGLLTEDLATYPDDTTAPTTHKPAAIQAVIAQMTPYTCEIILGAHPDIAGMQGNQTERWMHVPYSVRRLDAATLKAWAEPKVADGFGIPAANPFTPKKLNFIDLSQDAPTAAAPATLQDDEFGKVYFGRDIYQRTPEVYWSINVKSAHLVAPNARTLALRDIYKLAVDDALRTTLADAYRAGLQASVEIQIHAFGIYLTGYDDKAKVLLERILATLVHTAPSEEKFKQFKGMVERGYQDERRSDPLRIAQRQMEQVRRINYHTSEECLAELPKLTSHDLNEFAAQTFRQTYVQATLLGNMHKSDGIAVLEVLRGALQRDPKVSRLPYAEGAHRDKSVREFAGEPLVVAKTAECDASAVFVTLEQGRVSRQKRATQGILSMALGQRFFDDLRTKQKTSYVVGVYPDTYNDEMYLHFVVQPNRHSPADVCARIEQFLEKFVDSLSDAGISEEEFKRHQEALKTLLVSPIRSLEEEGMRMHRFAWERDGHFDDPEKMAEIVAALDYQTFLKAVGEQLGAENRQRLAVLVTGTEKPVGGVVYQAVESPQQAAARGNILQA